MAFAHIQFHSDAKHLELFLSSFRLLYFALFSFIADSDAFDHSALASEIGFGLVAAYQIA